MEMAVSLSAWRTSLSAALGLAAVACGGQSSSTENDDPSGASGGKRSETGGTSGTTSGGRGGSSGSSGSGATGSGGDSGGGGISGSSGASGASGSSGNAGTGGLDLECKNPQPVLAFDGSMTGFVTCDGGFVHRPERVECASRVPRPIDEPLPEVPNAQCDSDADCIERRHGHCEEIQDPTTLGRVRVCLYGCVHDEDCSVGFVCHCGDPVGTCTSASCATDADCGGLLCTSALTLSPCGTTFYGAFACQTPTDNCRGFDDCYTTDPSGGPQSMCFASTGSSRFCLGPGTCGRPFLVAGETRVATLVVGDRSWTSARAPEVHGLDEATRSELAAYFARLGLMEHASVAAFARFTLELLSLGAPSELVLASQRALGDEIRHATTCFGLASAYAGRPLGPGALEMAGSLDDSSFGGIVNRAIVEACIGETLAAVEALEGAHHASDPAVRRALAEIAEDEKRHAELGWRFLRWALERATAEERSRLEALLASAVADARARVHAETDATNDPRARLLLAHGLLTRTLVNRARAAALDELVVPLSRELVRATARRYEDRAADRMTVPSSIGRSIVS
jgi:hypothetical protein